MGPCGNYGETQDCRSAAGELVFVETASKRVIAGEWQETGVVSTTVKLIILGVWHKGTSPNKPRSKPVTEAGGRFLSRQRHRPAPYGRPGSGRAVSLPPARGRLRGAEGGLRRRGGARRPDGLRRDSRAVSGAAIGIPHKTATPAGRDQKMSMQRNAKSAMKIATVASDAAVGGYATSRHFPETLCSLWLKQLHHSTSHPPIFGIRLFNLSTFQPFNWAKPQALRPARLRPLRSDKSLGTPLLTQYPASPIRIVPFSTATPRLFPPAKPFHRS